LKLTCDITDYAPTLTLLAVVRM